MLAMASALHVPVHGELHLWPHQNCRHPCRSRKTNPRQDRVNLQGLNSIHKQCPTWSLRGGWSSPRVLRKAVLEEEKKSPWLQIDESTSRSGDEEPLSVSVIIPVHNEVATIATLVEKVGDVMQRRGGCYEIICVDDGSTDGTTRVLKVLAATRSDMQVVIFRRNFGQTAAMAAGFDFAAGQVFVTLDGDSQNEADEIPKLVNELMYGNQGGRALDTRVTREDGGFDLVCGWRRNRKDNLFTRISPSCLPNTLIGKLTGVKLHDYGCTLRAYRASLMSNLRLYGDMHRFIPALAAMEGAAISEIEVQHHPHKLSKSKYGLSRIFRFILDLTTLCFWQQFRDKPMHLMGLLGGLCIIGSLFTGAFAGWSLVKATQAWGFKVAISNATPCLVLTAELLIMGLQLMCLGLLAEVCVRAYYESQPQHVYRVREVATSAVP